jgi:hypothetical protein
MAAGVRRGNGWAWWLARLTMGLLAFEAVSGLAVTFAPFHPAVQWGVLFHTAVGALGLLPIAWYCAVHWVETRHQRVNADLVLGYAALAALFVCAASGLVVTWQGLLAPRTSWGWRQVHLWSTFALLLTMLPHLLVLVPRLRRNGQVRAAAGYLAATAAATAVGCALVAGVASRYSGSDYVNEFPADYNLLYGADRPFAPSLARTDTGGAFDPRSLAGSESCGTAGCHAQILDEWKPSAHHYAARDVLFQGIQEVMAKQNGAESTRYCGGCHDPISLFSGTKNLFVENLTGLHGYNEGVSCLACHAIRETDVKGNANYVITQPREYLWQWAGQGAGRLARDFLIRTYPAEHNRLSKTMFKTPEYCAACHKQFIDQEVNQVGWVQLQNQYDNWAASHWNVKGDPTKTIECRECHMPLVDSRDPAAGDVADYNRAAEDGKHRSHRFLAANSMMPALLKLEGWEDQVRLTERWLRGEHEIPEIAAKWAEGPIVRLALEVPRRIPAGEKLPIRVVFTSNKVGHDFPTGPLDIIQSWLHLRVVDGEGREIFASGGRDPRHFIAPGSFMFKAEPVDQYGNLIDRHNLWEMVGVRYRRSLFPGYSDAVEFVVDCPATRLRAGPAKPAEAGPGEFLVGPPPAPGSYRVIASLQYRKVDQFLLNFLLGEQSGITSPVTEIARAEATVEVTPL